MLEQLAAEKDAKKAMSEAKNQRLIDVDALLEAMPKDDVLLSFDVRKVILDAPIVDAVPLDFHNLCLEIGRAEIENLIALAKKNKWISVEDRLPEAGKILVTDGETVTISNGAWLYRSLEGKTRVPANYGAGLTVTHWMPLPEPPNEEEQ